MHAFARVTVCVCGGGGGGGVGAIKRGGGGGGAIKRGGGGGGASAPNAPPMGTPLQTQTVARRSSQKASLSQRYANSHEARRILAIVLLA